jgi:hypothetical protein
MLESFVEGNRPIRICSRGRHQELSLPRCLQRYGMDDSGTLVVPDEEDLFALEGRPEEDSIEALMLADRRVTHDGLAADFDVQEGRTVIVVRNEKLGPGR